MGVMVDSHRHDWGACGRQSISPRSTFIFCKGRARFDSAQIRSIPDPARRRRRNAYLSRLVGHAKNDAIEDIGMSMRNMTCIEDLRQVARRRVPRAFFDYAEAGSYSQETLRANRADLERIKLRQRVLVDVSQRDLTTTIIGEKTALPLMLAPIGLCGMQRGDGEILACRAAQN